MRQGEGPYLKKRGRKSYPPPLYAMWAWARRRPLSSRSTCRRESLDFEVITVAGFQIPTKGRDRKPFIIITVVHSGALQDIVQSAWMMRMMNHHYSPSVRFAATVGDDPHGPRHGSSHEPRGCKGAVPPKRSDPDLLLVVDLHVSPTSVPWQIPIFPKRWNHPGWAPPCRKDRCGTIVFGLWDDVPNREQWHRLPRDVTNRLFSYPR